MLLIAGLTLAWVPWVSWNQRIFQMVYKELTEFEKASLIQDAKPVNQRIEIPNVDPVLIMVFCRNMYL